MAAQPLSDNPECLLVSCSDLVPLFEKGLGFKCDESFLEESAVNSVSRSIRKNQPYRFIFVDLDDPTLLLGRFMASINAQLEQIQDKNVKIDVARLSVNTDDPRWAASPARWARGMRRLPWL